MGSLVGRGSVVGGYLFVLQSGPLGGPEAFFQAQSSKGFEPKWLHRTSFSEDGN